MTLVSKRSTSAASAWKRGGVLRCERHEGIDLDPTAAQAPGADGDPVDRGGRPQDAATRMDATGVLRDTMKELGSFQPRRQGSKGGGVAGAVRPGWGRRG